MPSVNVLWARGNKGSYDNGLLMHALRGSLWLLPDGLRFDEHMGLVAPTPGGAVVVIAGRHMLGVDDHEYLRASLARLPWAVLFHLGDEELRFPSELFRAPGRRIALQAPNPFIPIRGDRAVMYGWPEDCRAWLRHQPRLAASARKRWGFAGQNNHAQRAELFSLLRARPEGEGHLVETPGFAQGLSRADYYKLLAESCIVPCPAGPFTPETFRFYEALEAGCIPIPAPTAPCGGWPADFDYWKWRYPDGDLLSYEWDYLLHPETAYGSTMLDVDVGDVQYMMTRTLAWWIGEKRKYVHELVDDVRDLAGIDTQEKVSVVITVSPVPSHPSVDMLADTIARIRAYPELKRAEIIICCDGVRPELEHRRNDYEEFLRVMVDRCNWDESWFGCLPVIHDAWVHQAEMVRQALEMVRTPVVFLVEHDTYPMGEIPFAKIIHRMQESELNHVRLHIFESVHPEHVGLYGKYFHVAETQYMETRQYSFRPHLARTSWMKNVMARYFEPGFRGFVEDTLTSPAEGGLLKGLYIYAPDGSMLRSGTVDGRGSDAKAPHGEP